MYTFIVNPHSRSGEGQKTWEEIHLLLEKNHIPLRYILPAIKNMLQPL